MGQERVKTTAYENSVKTTDKYFHPDYEKLITYETDGTTVKHTYEINYINAPSGLCAMYVKADNSQGIMYNTYTDYLGSILTLTDENGKVLYDQSFDAWGKKRNPDTWDSKKQKTNIPDEWLTRGFTGHEHLPLFGLINMNGRCYDPAIGSMLSPDNNVSDVTSSNAFNRYSYALNNPLKYTDPSGMDIHEVLSNNPYVNKIAPASTFDRILGTAINLFFSLQQAGVFSKHDDLTSIDEHKISESQGIGNFERETIGIVSPRDYEIDYETRIIYKPGTYQIPSGANTLNPIAPVAGRIGAMVIQNTTNPANHLVNPSGGALRGPDKWGDGHYGASRDGGTRTHLGIDILTPVGQKLVAPVTGSAMNSIGVTHGLPMIDIKPSNTALKIDKVRILYVNMPFGTKPGVPYNVTAGQSIIGTAADLEKLGYPKGITPHIHVQIMVGGRWVDPTPYFFH